MERMMRLAPFVASIAILHTAAGRCPAQESAELHSASFVVGDLLVFWQAGKGSTITYRGLPVFAANPGEFVVHHAWQEVFYRTERGNETATLADEPNQSVLTIRDRDEHFALQKRIIAHPDGSFRVEYAYEVLEPEQAELQLLWGIGKPWIDGSHYRIVVNGQERTGELNCPAEGRIDPWGGATEQVFTTDYGTLTIKSERALNLLCNPGGGSLWYAQAMTRGEKYTESLDVHIEPGPAADTGLKLAALDWTEQVRDGRVRFTLKLARTPKGPNRVSVQAEQNGEAAGEPAMATLGEKPGEVTCEARLARKGQVTYAVVISNPADGKEVLRVGPLLVKSSPYMRVMPRVSLYTGEQQGEVVVDLADDLELDGLSVVLTGQGLAETRQAATAHRVLLPVNVAALPDGVTELTCRLLQGDKPLAEAQTQLRKAPPKPNEVKIDNLSRSLIADGLPFVPFGFYTYYPLKEGVMDGEVVRGFNLFSPYHGGPHEGDKLAPILQYLDRCAAIGMRVNYHIMWPYGTEMNDEQMAQFRAEVEAVRDHPALLSWYTADEPGAEYVPQLTRIYNLLKELDPYHPVTIVFCQGCDHALKFADAMDIMMADPYPIPQGPPTNVSRTMDEFNEAFDFRIPMWVVPQAFGGNEWWQREPTAQEQRVMTYLSLIHGARAVQYFIRSPRVSFPKSPIMWAECGTLALETAELTPALTSDEPAPQVTASLPTVHACALKDRGVVTVLAVNTEKQPQVVRLQVEGLDFTGEADVLFEDRKVSVTAGAIEEPIDAYGTRAYAIPVGPLPADDLSLDPGNLVVDPSWENTPSVGTPSACYANIPTGATCFVDSRVARHGRHSLRMTGPADDQLPSLTPFPVQVKGGQTYRVSIWAKAKADGVVLKVSLGGLGKEEFPLTTEWEEYSFTVAPEKDASRVSPGLALGSPGVAWLDLLQVVPQ
jgi:hypothetical protein